MTSALHRSPSQAKRESRRFEVLVAQRRRLLASLEECKWRLENLLVFFPAGRIERAQIETDLTYARAAIAEVRLCRVVPLEDPK